MTHEIIKETKGGNMPTQVKNELIARMLVQNDKMVQQLGILCPELVNELYTIYPEYKVKVKIKGIKGDRGVIEATIDDVYNDNITMQGEYISQVIIA